MSEGMFSAVVLGTLVEGSIAYKFKKAIEPYSAEEVIKDFVYSVFEDYAMPFFDNMKKENP